MNNANRVQIFERLRHLGRIESRALLVKTAELLDVVQQLAVPRIAQAKICRTHAQENVC